MKRLQSAYTLGMPQHSDENGLNERGSEHLSQTVRTILALAASYQLGVISEAEQAVDTYLATHRGYRSRKEAIDALRRELADPSHRGLNRGGLFEQVESHLQQRHRELVVSFQ
jgi:hypothetical protein